MKWTLGQHTLDLLDEPSYSFGSTDNRRTYERELLLTSRNNVTSKHGLSLFVNDVRTASLLIGAGAGATGVHERSAIIAGTLCFVAAGNALICLTLPTLDVQWHHEADAATCFGLHLSPDKRAVVVHGELAISKWTFAGEALWSHGGADIFTGSLSIIGQTAVVADFESRTYRIDLETGRAL